MAGLEEYKRLDVRQLHKADMLRPGLWFSWQWTRGNEPAGNIYIRTEEDRLVLEYRYRENGGEWQDVKETVHLVWTACHYGGRRPWFRCPGCGRRVGILAAAGSLFLCRHCYRLKYCSQLEGDMDRANSRIRNIKKRLGEKTWLKPKGMHQKTFDQLHEKLTEAEMRADEVFCMSVARLSFFKHWNPK